MTKDQEEDQEDQEEDLEVELEDVLPHHQWVGVTTRAPKARLLPSLEVRVGPPALVVEETLQPLQVPPLSLCTQPRPARKGRKESGSLILSSWVPRRG
jgi:hypothetical protein